MGPVGEPSAIGFDAADAGAGSIPPEVDLEDVMARINRTCPRLRLVPPVSKRLACDDVGVGAMASVADIVETVLQELLRAPGQ